MMDEETADKVGAWITRHQTKVVDITGGAPEISGFFRHFVDSSHDSGKRVYS